LSGGHFLTLPPFFSFFFSSSAGFPVARGALAIISVCPPSPSPFSFPPLRCGRRNKRNTRDKVSRSPGRTLSPLFFLLSRPAARTKERRAASRMLEALKAGDTSLFFPLFFPSCLPPNGGKEGKNSPYEGRPFFPLLPFLFSLFFSPPASGMRPERR